MELGAWKLLTFRILTRNLPRLSPAARIFVCYTPYAASIDVYVIEISRRQTG